MSVDPPDASKRLKERLNVQFTFLSDADGKLLDALDIRHREGYQGNDIAYPTSILVDSDGTVRWTWESDTYRERATPDEIFAALDALPPPAAGRDLRVNQVK